MDPSDNERAARGFALHDVRGDFVRVVIGGKHVRLALLVITLFFFLNLNRPYRSLGITQLDQES